MNQPVTLAVIASPGHSGQTWLSLLIGSHPRAISLGEVDELYGLSSLDHACMLCGESCEFWSEFNKAWSPERNMFTQLADYSGAGILSISKLEKFRGQIDDERIRLKVIRLLRDGRAVTASYARKYPSRQYDEIVRQWVFSARENDKWFLQIPPENRMVVKYENLLEHTPATLRSICAFLGIDYREDMIEYWKVKHHIVDGNRGTMSFVQRYFGKEGNPKDKEFYGSQDPASFRDERWKKELTPRQLRRFRKIGGALNIEYGYASADVTGGQKASTGSYLNSVVELVRKRVYESHVRFPGKHPFQMGAHLPGHEDG